MSVLFSLPFENKEKDEDKDEVSLPLSIQEQINNRSFDTQVPVEEKDKLSLEVL